MKNTLSGELLVVGWCVVCGVASGVWYDFFRALRKEGFNANWMVVAEDVVFWIGETAIVYAILFYANNGILRWYEFVFTLLGFAMYRMQISDFVVGMWRKLFILFKAIKKLLRLIKINKNARFLRKSEKSEKKQR